MEYLIRAAESTGEVVTLYSVAEGMARHSAEAGGRGFHKPAFGGALPRYVDAIIAAAVSGQLHVCNQFGRQGTTDGILEEARRTGAFISVQDNESMTLALNVWVRLHHLNAWAQEQGDVFRIEWTWWKDERGYVDPSGTGQPIETPQADERVGAHSAAVVPGGESGVENPGLSTKEISQSFESMNGWNADRWVKNLSAHKWLHPARMQRGVAGAGGATSVWNPLTLAQLLHGKANGERSKQALLQILRARFKQIPILQPWRDELNEYVDTHLNLD